MTEKGYHVLKALIDNSYVSYIDQVISSKDTNVEQDFYDEIKELCSQNKIPFLDKSKGSSKSKYNIAISWRWLIDVCNLIVLHDSVLPRYRGFAPLVMALVNGDKKIGVTAIFANAEFDKGDIILQKTIDISYPIKISEAIKMISILYVEIVLELMKIITASETINVIKQDDSKATYSLWRDEEDYVIEWHRDSLEIERFINATGFPFKGASTIVNGEASRILEVEQVADVKIENRTPGKVIFIYNGSPVIVCGKGLLKIKKMIWENGSNALPLKNFRTRFQ